LCDYGQNTAFGDEPVSAFQDSFGRRVEFEDAAIAGGDDVHKAHGVEREVGELAGATVRGDLASNA